MRRVRCLSYEDASSYIRTVWCIRTVVCTIVIGISKIRIQQHQFSKHIQTLKDTHYMFRHVLCDLQV
jgi:hypothetical protein